MKQNKLHQLLTHMLMSVMWHGVTYTTTLGFQDQKATTLRFQEQKTMTSRLGD